MSEKQLNELVDRCGALSKQQYESTHQNHKLVERCSALSERLMDLKSKLANEREEIETLEREFKLGPPPQCSDELPAQASVVNDNDDDAQTASRERVPLPLPRVEASPDTDSEDMSDAEEQEAGDKDDKGDKDSEPKPKKPRKDPLVEFGSHERVLTHYMHLDAGFTLEMDEENKLQVITPKRTKSNELKSFRSRLGKHLRAIGFVCVEDDDEKPEEEAQFAQMDLNEHAWVRPTVDADGKNVALNEHTLEPIVDKEAVQDEQGVVDPFSLA